MPYNCCALFIVFVVIQQFFLEI